MKPNSVILVALMISCVLIKSQTNAFKDEAYKWPNHDIKNFKVESQNLNEDLVILNERIDFDFYSYANEYLSKRVILKINTDEGLKQIKSMSYPESFDEGYDASFIKQGRKSKIKDPFIYSYKLITFMARKLGDKGWEALNYKATYESYKRIASSGEFIPDERTKIELSGIALGDIIEYYYKCEFIANYGTNIFYFASKFPKQSGTYSFNYKMDNKFADNKFVLPINVPDSSVKVESLKGKDVTNFNIIINLKNIAPIRYQNNLCPSKQVPHVFADFKFFRVLKGTYSTGEFRVLEVEKYRPKNFEWLIVKDTVNQYTKINDKHFSNIRKFCSTLPAIVNDSTKMAFIAKLCDTINTCRYITSNSLFYNESALYNLSSSDHLLKSRLVEHLTSKLILDILNDNKLFYYITNIQDKRYGEHNFNYRAHYAYESTIAALPVGKTFIYFVPRFEGVKYFLNELPFYYEGTTAALFAKNFQNQDQMKDQNNFKLITTHHATFNENSRIENTNINVNLDALTYSMTIKESLSGQFSTILRHWYNNNNIDSTLQLFYFKKCTDKLNPSSVKVKLSSKLNTFPFRHNYVCSGEATISEPTKLSLKNWLSIPIPEFNFDKNNYYDFYFDFEFSDNYNFLINFNKSVTILNESKFNKEINSRWFNFNSQLIKNADGNYLLKIKLDVKDRVVKHGELIEFKPIVDFIKELDRTALEIKY